LGTRLAVRIGCLLSSDTILSTRYYAAIRYETLLYDITLYNKLTLVMPAALGARFALRIDCFSSSDTILPIRYYAAAIRYETVLYDTIRYYTMLCYNKLTLVMPAALGALFAFRIGSLSSSASIDRTLIASIPPSKCGA
jgi:hypothetical protein